MRGRWRGEDEREDELKEEREGRTGKMKGAEESEMTKGRMAKEQG